MTITVSDEQDAEFEKLNPRRGPVDPGRYLCRVTKALEKMSSGGEAMIALELVEDSTNRILTFDNIMLSGKGYGIGKAKMIALGVIDAEAKGFTIDTSRLAGLRFFVHLKHEVSKKDGKTYAKVDISQEGCGYERQEMPTDDEAKLEASKDVPF